MNDDMDCSTEVVCLEKKLQHYVDGGSMKVIRDKESLGAPVYGLKCLTCGYEVAIIPKDIWTAMVKYVVDNKLTNKIAEIARSLE